MGSSGVRWGQVGSGGGHAGSSGVKWTYNGSVAYSCVQLRIVALFTCNQRKCVTVSDKYPKVITLTQLLNRMNRKLRRRRTCATSISTQSLIMSHEKVVIPLWEHCSSTSHEMFLLMQQFICLMKHQVFRKRKSFQPFIETMFRKKRRRDGPRVFGRSRHDFN